MVVELEGTFSGTGQSSSVAIKGDFNLSLSDYGSATIVLQRSFDSGSNWFNVESYTEDTQKRGFEPESSILYRLNCTSHSSGTIAYRISR